MNLNDMTKAEAFSLADSGSYIIWSTSDGRWVARPRQPLVGIASKVRQSLSTRGPTTEATLYNVVGRHNQIDEKEFSDLLGATAGLRLIGNKWMIA